MKHHITIATTVVAVELALAVVYAFDHDWQAVSFCVALAAAWALIHIKDLDLASERRRRLALNPVINLNVALAQRNVTLRDEIARLENLARDAQRKAGGH